MQSDTSNILAGLNEPQKRAVTELRGPLLILAGAGSGKTKALTHRIANLMQQGIEPWQILAVTFTNRAAKEMKERIKRILQIGGDTDIAGEIGQGRLPTMGTFHSICARILRRDITHLGRDRNFVIYDGDDQEKLMKEVLKKLRIDEKELKPKAALGYVGRFKNEAINPQEAARQASTERLMIAAKVYREYQDELVRANAMDFDDLIVETVRLFHEHPAVLERYQDTWQFLHVDEYQDTNHAQYLFITLLARKYRNLCVIGDPDQSIYAFRGADIRNILEFKQEYTDAIDITLDQNYRSTQIVLTAANAVIDANPNRPKKEMWSERKEGPLITLHQVRDERKEAEEAIRAIQTERAAGRSLNDQVILYRTNAQSRLFEEACLRAGLPYRLIGGVKFYARREVKDVLAYLHVITNPNDTVSLMRIINVPARKIGATSMQHIQNFAARENLTLWQTLLRIDEVVELNSGLRDRIYAFTDLLKRKQEQANIVVVSELTQGLLSEIEFEKWLRDDSEEGEERWNNVQELFTVMKKYDQLDPQTSLMSFLEEVALVSEVDKLATAQDDAVTLMTLHLCKGLEYEHVLIAGCEEGLFPHSNTQFDKEQLEEERRLMYVGMTRAKTKLHILYARTRNQWGNEQANAPSRFLDDLPEAMLERRSDELLSAFAWASERGVQQVRRSSGPLQPFRQPHSEAQSEFNQDISFDDASQEQAEFFEGARVAHPSFGAGTITTRRGDIVNIAFDNGQKKTFALNIAPLKLL